MDDCCDCGLLCIGRRVRGHRELCACAEDPFEIRAARVLVIATSPAVEEAMAQLGRAFEASHPDVRVQLSSIRRSIFDGTNRREWRIGQSLYRFRADHLVAPGGDEVITRMDRSITCCGGQGTVCDGTSGACGARVVKRGAGSFESLANMPSVRIAIADLKTRLGWKPIDCCQGLGLKNAEGKRIDLTTDQGGILIMC